MFSEYIHNIFKQKHQQIHISYYFTSQKKAKI